MLRGVYDYPGYSNFLEQQLSPDINQVAHALARRFGWRIQPDGSTAQNLLGLSTQVPAGYLYRSDGPKRSYRINETALQFRHTALKESGFRYRESSLVVQALKSLGQEHITPEVIRQIRSYFNPSLRAKILKDTRTVTTWIYSAIKEICTEETDG